jgi:hypothetical protein
MIVVLAIIAIILAKLLLSPPPRCCCRRCATAAANATLPLPPLLPPSFSSLSSSLSLSPFLLPLPPPHLVDCQVLSVPPPLLSPLASLSPLRWHAATARRWGWWQQPPPPLPSCRCQTATTKLLPLLSRCHHCAFAKLLLPPLLPPLPRCC